VRLVKTVVERKTAVHPSSRFPLISPNTTITPEPIPARLISTWTHVKVDMLIPRIMGSLLTAGQIIGREGGNCHF
jgi:hypothetical protein